MYEQQGTMILHNMNGDIYNMHRRHKGLGLESRWSHLNLNLGVYEKTIA